MNKDAKPCPNCGAIPQITADGKDFFHGGKDEDYLNHRCIFLNAQLYFSLAEWNRFVETVQHSGMRLLLDEAYAGTDLRDTKSGEILEEIAESLTPIRGQIICEDVSATNRNVNNQR